jgi:hypothetical protein
MSTITTEQQAAIASKLANMQLPSGLGNEHSACSIAAINLALSGRLTAKIPDCMSGVIGRWIIVIQDAMPGALRNSGRWKSLLPLAAGTGRVNEQERLDIILEWMWGTVLPSLQPLADKQGFGAQWKKMTTERTAESARAAAEVAYTLAAEVAAEVAAEAAEADAAEADAAEWATSTAAEVAGAAAVIAAALDRAAAWATAGATAWVHFDPCGLLERLIGIDNKTTGDSR